MLQRARSAGRWLRFVTKSPTLSWSSRTIYHCCLSLLSIAVTAAFAVYRGTYAWHTALDVVEYADNPLLQVHSSR